MKKFQSPLLKIHRLLEQQLKISELRLAEAQAAHLAAIREYESTKRLWSNENQQYSRQLPERDSFHLQLISSRQTRLAALEKRMTRQSETITRAQQRVDEARANWQEFKKRASGTEQLIAERKAEHRRTNMNQQQLELEENAAAAAIGQHKSRLPST